MNDLESYRGKVKAGRDMRLFNEWDRLHEACAGSDEVAYTVTKTNVSGLPVVYQVDFYMPSIVGVEDADEAGLQKPVFGDHHTLRISLPNNYPGVDGGYPEFKFMTDVWHPNVRYFGEFKGRVCLNLNDCGTAVYLTDHVATISGYLRYTDYHARDENPYPEDRTVAQWTLEQAEPQGWLHFNKPNE